MLVLSRFHGQSIKIGDYITLTIIRISGNTVRLGFTAPKDVRILRTEIIEREPNVKENSSTTEAG